MPSGGARIRSGPPADPNALKRARDGKEWVKLAPNGRAGKAAPPWPLPDVAVEVAGIEDLEMRLEALQYQARELSGRYLTAHEEKIDLCARDLRLATARRESRIEQEQVMWDQLWTMPQAVVWEADHAELQVALYVRAQLEAMEPYAASNSRTLAKQYAESLLLTIPSLHAMRYVIDDRLDGATPADLTGEKAAKVKVAKPNRFRVVRDGDTEEETS